MSELVADLLQDIVSGARAHLRASVERSCRTVDTIPRAPSARRENGITGRFRIQSEISGELARLAQLPFEYHVGTQVGSRMFGRKGRVDPPDQHSRMGKE